MDGSVTLANCVFWGNTPDQIHAAGTTTASYCDVKGGLPVNVTDGGGNIDVDPEFVNVIAGNYRLYYGSPCIDAADNDALPDDDGDIDDDGTTAEELPLDLDLIDRRTDDPDTTDTGNGTSPIVDMGAYEFVPCPWDLDESCFVGADDLLILLANWGGPYGAADLLDLLAAWGPCACNPEAIVPSLQDELDDACLSGADWADFLDKMATGTTAEKANYLCWMEHYLDDCTRCTCSGSPGCPDTDPFG